MDWDSSPALPVSLDILVDILLLLPLDAIFSLRRTCTALRAVTRLRTLWARLFRRHVLDRAIPYPHVGPICDLSAAELEALTLRASSLHRNWTSPRPAPRRRRMLDTPTEPSAPIIFLQFLPARANRWLISVRATARPRRYLLQCWDVAADPPKCVAELLHADGPYGGVVLNSDPTSSSVLAFQSAQTETFSIDFDAEDIDTAFVTEAVIDGVRELRLLSGSTLITRDVDNDSTLCLWDLSDLAQEKLQFLNPSLSQPDNRVQAIHLAHDYVIVVRLQSIEIYNTTPRPNILPVHRAPIAYPLAKFRFQWRTDTVVLCEHGPDGPLHLLVRYGSIYPVNVLHHYVLQPNPAYFAGSQSTPSSPATPRSASPLHTPTTEYNLPYTLSPILTHTIASPVHLFAKSAMTLGRYGTVLWIDNDAELGGPSERGQRVAGRMIQHADAHGKEPDADPCGASMVYSMRDDEGWTRVAMEEDAGRIALGHANGKITLLEY